MKAMIFAAGLGTRLRPLTNDRPKALVEVGGMSLLEISIRRLKYYGCTEIIINVHHFAEKIIAFLEKKKYFGIKISISHEKELLLETGGGLKKASYFFDDNQPFLVCNADILTDLDLRKFYDYHCQSNAIATMAVRNRKTSRYLIFNKKNELVGWRNIKTGDVKWTKKPRQRAISNRAFSGLHVISPAFFDYFPKDEEVFSIIPLYLAAAKEERVLAYPHDETIWLDVGKLPALKEAETIVPKLRLS
jgi:NDP-sugar pyrophosphorylase family protein